jgi:hypothetical protein
VLTILGYSFPTRVVPSLYDSFFGNKKAEDDYHFLINHLVVYSMKEFEDSAIQIANSVTAHGQLSKFQRIISEAISQKTGFFCSSCSAADFYFGMQSLFEANTIIKTFLHIFGNNSHFPYTPHIFFAQKNQK